MDHVWTVFCRRTIVDADTNQITIIDSIDDLYITVPGADRLGFLMDCVVASLWARSDRKQSEHGRFRIRLITPSGKSLGDGQIYPLDLGESEWLRTRVELPSLPIDGPGRYVFVTEVEEEGGGWRGVARTPYELEIRFKKKSTVKPPRTKKLRKPQRK